MKRSKTLPATALLEEMTEEEQVLEAGRTDDFFIFRRNYVRCGLFTRIEAMFFQDLWNLAVAPNTIRKKFDGKVFFLCTTEFLKRSLAWDPDSQKDLFEKLEAKIVSEKEPGRRLVSRKKSGLPPKRWVRIDVRLAQNCVRTLINSQREEYTPEQTGENTPQRREEYTPEQTGENTPAKTTKEKNIQKTSPDSPAANGGMSGHFPFGGEVKRTKARILADNLRDGLQAKRLIRNNNYNSAKWEKAFVSLLSDYKFSEINGDILIHVENVTGDYWPKCLSAESFCRDYPKIRLHIDKLKRKSGDCMPESIEAKTYKMPDGRTMYTTEGDE